MKTPRIEEIKNILTDFGISVDPHGYADGNFTESIERIIAYGEVERQAGKDEARSKVLIGLMSLPKISFPADKKLNGLYVEWSDINKLLNT